MIRRPHVEDFRVIGHYLGVVINGLALLMLVPLVTALIFAEWDVALDFVISISVGLIIGNGLLLISRPRRHDLTWMQGMMVAGLSYLVGMLVGALPYYLSGHWGSYLDASFDVMSGFTTTGLTLVQDLDHLAHGLNMWRHLLTYLGGQGMVVLALMFLIKDAAGAFKMYVSEAKDERLLPNAVHTARWIWLISIAYLLLGTAMLWVAGISLGIEPVRAFLHGMWIFMAAWSTGGFAPQGLNVIYYHSDLYLTIALIFMIIGSLNFGLHFTIWIGKRDEVYRNIETITFAITSTLLGALTVAGLAKLGTYGTLGSLLNKGYFNMISAHSGTGFQTVYAPQLVNEWGEVAYLGLVSAMLLGGSAVSTAGGFKALRVGVIFKALAQEVKRVLAPESAVIVEKYHYMREQVLGEATVRNAYMVVLLYLFTWGLGTIAGTISGFSLRDSLFESASALATVGLSIGVTSPAMPDFLKSAYIVEMWAGRMEFMAVLVLVGVIWAGVRGK